MAFNFSYENDSLEIAEIQQLFLAVSGNNGLTCATLVVQDQKQPLIVILDQRSGVFTTLDQLPKPQVDDSDSDPNSDRELKYQIALNYAGTELYVTLLDHKEFQGGLFVFEKRGYQWELAAIKSNICQTAHFALVPMAKGKRLVAATHDRLSLYEDQYRREGELNDHLVKVDQEWMEGESLALYAVDAERVLSLRTSQNSSLLLTHWAVETDDNFGTLILKKEIQLDIDYESLGIKAVDRQDMPYFMVADHDLICIGFHNVLYVLDYEGSVRHILRSQSAATNHMIDEVYPITQLWINDSHVFCRQRSEGSKKHYIKAYPIPALKNKPFDPTCAIPLSNKGKLTFALSEAQITEDTYVIVRPSKYPNRLDIEVSGLKAAQSLVDQDQELNQPDEIQRLPLIELGIAVDQAFKECVDKQVMPCFITDDLRLSYLRMAENRVSVEFNHWLACYCSDPIKAVIIPNGTNPPTYIIVDYPNLIKWDKYQV